MTAAKADLAGSSRWVKLLACAAAMLAIANLQYAWTLFAEPLTKSLNASLAAVSVAFTLFVIAQTGLFPIVAYLVDRIGPRLVVSVGALLVGAGWIGSGLAESLAGLYTAYAIGGLGAGAVYSACVGVAMKWFPDRRGLCVGIVAGSYGFGTALTNIPISHMIETTGYQSAFITWGAIQGVVVLIAAQFLRMPQPGWVPEGWETIKAKIQRKVQQSVRDYAPNEMLKTRSFYLLYLMMSLVTFGGLMVTAQIAPIAKTYGFDRTIVFTDITIFGVTIYGAVTALNLTVTLNQVLNGSARPFFGWISDHAGRYDTMTAVFLLGAISITLMTFLVNNATWFIVISALTFFAWGDIYSLFPAAIADLFGTKHSTTNYGIQYTAKGVGSILAGPGAALMMDATGSWLPVLTAAVLCNVAAAALAAFWLKPLVKRLMSEQAASQALPQSDALVITDNLDEVGDDRDSPDDGAGPETAEKVTAD